MANENNTLLKVKNLKTYLHTDVGIVKAVDGVSFDVRHGETLGIIGESGSGKSMTSLSIINLLQGTGACIIGGEVILESVDLLKLNWDEMRKIRGKRIAMIFQDPMTSLNPFMKIGRQMDEAIEYHLEVTSKQARNRTIELLEQVGIPDAAKRINSYPHEFSGGMRQRVMIAMALSCQPELVIADEPTSALDVTVQSQILDLLDDMRKKLGSSVILISHNLGVVAGRADHIIVMYAGKVVETAQTKELFSNPKHPYTIGLMKSIPKLDGEKKDFLESITGQPPDPIGLPMGCSFSPRCSFAQEKCTVEEPCLRQVAPKHEISCWVNV